MAVIYGTTGPDTRNGTVGNDLIHGWASGNVYTSPSGNDTLNGAGGKDTLYGGTGNDSLIGGTGDDTLSGNAGSDIFNGGTGDDTYIIDSATDKVTEAASSGTDTVQSYISYTLGNNLEKLTLVGTSAINGTGNSLNNTIIGNTVNNTLDGGGGNDTLDGGLGSNTLNGGTGNDTYIIEGTLDGCVAKTLLGQSFPINQLWFMQQLRKFDTRILLDLECHLFRFPELVPCGSCSLLRTLLTFVELC